MNASSTTAIWSILNQLQLLVLFLLIDQYIPDDVRGSIEGQDFALFNFDFIPATDIPYINIPTEWMDFEQSDVNLAMVGVKSRSTFTNMFSLLLTIVSLFAIHILVKLLPKCKNHETNNSKGKLKRTWSLLRAKLLDWFMYVIYIRMVLEANQVLLFSSFKELDIFAIDDAAAIMSLVIAMLVLLFCLFLLIEALYLFCKHFKNYDPEEKFLFMEYYADIKNKKWARLYTTLLLARRLLFVLVIIILSFLGGQGVLIILLVVQAFYLVALIILRPFEEIKSNIIEITNESFYFVFVILMLVLNSEEKWTDPMTKFFLYLMTANTIMILVIMAVCFIIAITSFCAQKCKKKSPQVMPRIRTLVEEQKVNVEMRKDPLTENDPMTSIKIYKLRDSPHQISSEQMIL